MTSLTLRAAGPVSPDTAWQRYLHPARWPSWSPQITAVQCSAEQIAPGVTGRVHGPLGVRLDFTVEEVDAAARTWSWTARFGPVRMRWEHGVEAAGTGTLTWLRLRGPLPVALAYAPLAQLALHRLVH